MFVLNLLNGIIYNSIKNSDSKYIKKFDNIYTFLPKNALFPYIFIECKNVMKDCSYKCNTYTVETNINIYDDNTSNLDILNATNDIQNIIENINCENILDINITNINNSFNNSLQPYYKTTISVGFLVIE